MFAVAIGLLVAASGPILLFDNHERASGACHFNGPDWVCDPAKLQHLNMQAETVIDPIAGADVQAVLVRAAKGGCPVAVDLMVKPTAEAATIDWSKVSFVVNGIAAQAVPGYATRLNASLAVRPSVAPAGAMIAEQVWSPGHQGDCLTTTPEFSIVLDAPMTLGGTSAHLRVTSTQAWVPATLHQALMFLPDLTVPVDPGEAGDQPFVTMTVVGAAVGLGVGAGAGAGLGYLLGAYAPNTDHSTTTVIAVTSTCGGILGVAGAILGGLAGADKDKGPQQEWAQKRETHGRAVSAKQRQDALVRQRAATAPPDGASPTATTPAF